MKTIFEWADYFQDQVLNGASQSDIIELLLSFGNEHNSNYWADYFQDRVLNGASQSEFDFKIGDSVKWRGMDLVVVEVGIDEIMIATSENVDDENYNDWWVPSKYVKANL
jgi:hypothetical protein